MTVVIAIIAILAAMLLPALSKARSKARTISCVNNHKTVALLSALYADDNNQMLPLYVMARSWGTRFHWFDHLIYTNYCADDSVIASCPTIGRTTKGPQGHNQIYGCISVSSDYISGVYCQESASASWQRCANVARVKNPSIGFYTCDTVFGYDRDNMGLKIGDQIGAWNFGNSIAGDSGPKARHDGRNVCDFVDGHAEAILPQTWAKNCYDSGMYVQRDTYSMWLDDGDGTGDPTKYKP